MMDDERDARIAALEAQIKGLEATVERFARAHERHLIAGAETRSRAEAAETALADMTKERDEALHFLDVAVDKSPEPLKKLGKHLASLLDEDDWPTAERLLNGAATALAAERAKTAKLVEAGRAIANGAWRNSDAIRAALPMGALEKLDAALRDMEAGQ